MAQLSKITVADGWRTAHPGGSVGLLALGNVAEDRSQRDRFAARRAALETELRQRFASKSRADLLAELPALQAYAAYYRRFKKTYHVLLQLESVVFKGRSIAAPLALVTATFMAELQNLLLTATHDLDTLQAPLRIGSATGAEHYTLLNGSEVEAKADDMLMADAAGTVCTVIAGQAARGSVTPDTRRTLFVVYAPPCIALEAVQQHLADLEALVQLFAPAAQREGCEVRTARSHTW
jgi:DNA/RNA-binding domain of Phe-tRNA-synthetase-like protein